MPPEAIVLTEEEFKDYLDMIEAINRNKVEQATAKAAIVRLLADEMDLHNQMSGEVKYLSMKYEVPLYERKFDVDLLTRELKIQPPTKESDHAPGK